MDRDFLIDLFADFGPVTIRKMFSGFGISVDGVNFALALRAGLFFRADDQTIPQFEAEGSKPFQYQTSTKTVTVNSYWELPARLFDDSEELSDWARAALAAAQRAALRKRPKARKAAKKAAKKPRNGSQRSAQERGRIQGPGEGLKTGVRVRRAKPPEALKPPGCASRRRIRDRLRRPRGCGHCAWRRRGRRRRARSANPWCRPVSTGRRRPKW